jgi:hypothetical protein
MSTSLRGSVRRSPVAHPPVAARSLRDEWTRLAAGVGDRGSFAPEPLAGLPEPVRRWLTHAIAPGTPLWSSAQLRMRGQIKLRTWRPFTARQVLAPPRGFIWAATARVTGLPVTGFDRYTSGSGEMRWRLLGLVPVMADDGADVTRSAAGRLAGEGTAWLPTAFADASWSAGPDADTAVATWRIGDHEEAVQLRIDPEGRLREIFLQRWGNPDGRPFGLYPFSVTVDAERAFGGLTIPSTVRATWWSDEPRPGDGEFFRAEITGATFR